MKKDREEAISLRKSGMSYAEIKKRLSVPKSTLSSWFRDQKWSNDIAIKNARLARNTSAVRLVVLNTIRGNRLKALYQEARQDALTDFEELKHHPLFIAGVVLYLAHGDKASKHRLSLSSSDPKTIRLFAIFLQNICGVKNIRAWLLLDPKIDETAGREYWISKCGLKHEYFTKTVIRKQNNAQKTPQYGVCNVLVNSAYLKNKILRWIELLTEEIGEEKYLLRV